MKSIINKTMRCKCEYYTKSGKVSIDEQVKVISLEGFSVATSEACIKVKSSIGIIIVGRNNLI